jgi:membrane protease YdiL (CAAX protease family)
MNFGSSIFLLPDGRLRAGWRLVLFCLLFLFATAVGSGPVSPIFAAASLTFNAVIRATATLAATWLMMRFVEKRPLQEVGLIVALRSGSEAGWGLVGGIVLAGSVTGIEWAAGLIFFQVSGTSASEAMASVVPLTGVLLASAAAEEMLFRGYPFQRLIEGVGGLPAIAVASLVFGALHASNPHSTGLGILNTVLAGILLSLAYLMTRALWLPIGLHFGWNWSLAVFDLPVSGLELMEMPWRAVPISAYPWLHGGDYGPEGGLITTLVLSLGIVYLARKLPKADSSRANPATPAAGESDPT